MKFELHSPCDRLKPYIKHFVISENEVAQTYKVLPDTSLVMGFQYGGRLAYIDGQTEILLATAGITGLANNYRIFKNTPQTGTVLVVFKETGAAHFLKQPLHELFGESISLEHFFSLAEIRNIEELVHEATSDQEKITIVEQFLISRLNVRPVDLLVNKALEYIHKSKGTIRISALAQKLNTSQSPLEKRFRREVGASPKKFAAIVRARNILSALDEDNTQLVEHLSSYYDQAHFTKDFKRFTAFTPEQYLKIIRQAKP